MRVDALRRFPGAIIAIHALSFWPVWRWFAARTTDGSDEPWGIAALVVALALSWPHDWRLRLRAFSNTPSTNGMGAASNTVSTNSPSPGWGPLLRILPPAGFGRPVHQNDSLLIAAAVLTFIYAVSIPFAPPLVRAVIAMAALACSWVSITRSRDKLPVVLVLFALSLPVIASLQFYAGFPLRTVTAGGATALLNLVGMDVERLGTAMIWQGQTVLVDAPCSGVRMLWTGAALCCVLAAQREVVTWRGLAIALVMVIPITLAANTLRAALLFVLETRPVPASDLLHASVGVVTFTLAAALLVASETLLRKTTIAVWQNRYGNTSALRLR
jgi:exosortase